MKNYKLEMNSNDCLPLRDVVFNTIRNAILSGKLEPGQRLMENKLADELGVSRTPIREALRMLEQENLVGLAPRKGAQVLDMSEGDIKNLLVIRGALEALAVKLACEKVTPEDIEQLKKLQVNFVCAYDSKDYELTADADEKFHDYIFDITKNNQLIQIINNLRIQLYRYRVAYLKISWHMRVGIEHHYQIIEALENNDPEKGQRVSIEHMKHTEEVIINSLIKKDEQNSEYSE